MAAEPKSKRRKITRRPWTEHEEMYLREWYLRKPTAELSRHLQRTDRAIFGHAHKLGLVGQRVSRATVREALLRLHPLGYSDNEIARELKAETGLAVDRHGVSAMRKKLKLPSNKNSARQRARVAASTRKQLQAAGLKSMAELRKQKWRATRKNLGWPDSLSIRAVQALELFWRHKTLTRLQLCKLMGVSSSKRTAPICNRPGGTVLAELVAAGFVTRLPRAVKVPADFRSSDELKPSRPRTGTRTNKHKYIDLYFLSPGVTPNASRRTK